MQCPQGNPIDPASGNKYQHEIDYAPAGVSPLGFSRYYNSASPRHSHLGQNWRHDYDRKLVRLTAPGVPVVKAFRADGRELGFWSDGQDWLPDSDVPDRLIELKDSAGQTLGWRYTVDEGEQVEDYNATGQLQSLTFRHGPVLLFHYSDASTPSSVAPSTGLLLRIEDSVGHALQFTYTSQSQIASLTDPAGQLYQYGYDSAGRLTSVTFPDTTPADSSDNPSRRYHYEDSRFPNALTGVTDERGVRFATWSYDAQGRAISGEHAGAEHVTLLYNTDGSTTVSNALGKQAIFRFQTVQGVRKLVAVDGQPTVLCAATHQATTYDALGWIDTTTEANGQVTDYDHDSRGLETQRIEAAGTALARTVFTEWHSTFRLPTCVIEPDRTTQLSYDTRGLLLEQADTDTTDAGRFPNPVSKTCAAIAARTDFASLNRRAWRYTYTTLGQIESVDGPRLDVNDVTTFAYDTQGNLVTVTNALGHLTQIGQHDAAGRPVHVQDPNGLLTVLSYDPRGRLLSRQVGTELTQFAYDPAGYLTRITLPTTATLDYAYDAAGRVIQITDQRGQRITFTLDAAGNRTQEQVHDAQQTLVLQHNRVFDELNRLRRDLGAAQQTTSFQYDLNGNRTEQIDPLNHPTQFAFDAFDRLTRITDAAQGVTRFTYDAQHRVTAVTDPRQVTTTYLYDGLGNRLEENSPDRGITSYDYDAAGNLVSQTDGRGFTTRLTYDALNRLTQTAYADGTTDTFTYDTGPFGVGRLTRITDPTGTTDFTYDQPGRVLTQTQTRGTLRLTLTTAYDPAGRITEQTTPAGRRLEYRYDADRLTDLFVDGQPVLSALTYRPFGPATGWTFGNGQAFQRQFDLDGRLITQTLGLGPRTIHYDPAGRLTNLTDTANTLALSYDPLDRLTATSGSFARTYTYDANGNRTTAQVDNTVSTSTTEADSNRLLAITTGTITRPRTYDAIGNTLTDGVNVYGYDARGRLIEVRGQNGSLVATYRYNARGQRVEKTVTLATPVRGDANGDGVFNHKDIKLMRRYLHHHGAYTAAYDCDGNGTLHRDDLKCWEKELKRQRHDNKEHDAAEHADREDDDRAGHDKKKSPKGLPVPPSTRSIHRAFFYTETGHLLGEYDLDRAQWVAEYVYFEGQPVALFQGGQRYFLHPDHLGTPRVATDAQQRIVWRWDGDPFGNNEPVEDVDGDGVRVEINLRFPGQYFDAETGLHYNYFRTYDPSTGRYLTSDPIGLNGGLNTYAYVVNNPLGFVDPLGLTQEDIDRLTELARDTQSDLNVPPPGSIGTAPFIGDGSAITNPITLGVTVDNFYLQELNDQQRQLLLETIIHESIHRTRPRSDMLRRPFEHTDIYNEAERRRKEVDNSLCY